MNSKKKERKKKTPFHYSLDTQQFHISINIHAKVH